MSKRSRRLRLSPLNLIEIRSGLAERERAEIAGPGEWGTWFERMRREAWDAADSLATAPAWWVSPEMTSVAVAAADGVPEDVPPSTYTGFIVFASSLPESIAPGLGHRVRAVHWTAAANGPAGPEGALRIACQYFTSDKDALADAGERRLPLAMIKVDRSDLYPMRVADVLRAVWALSSQPGICEIRGVVPAFPPGPTPPDPMARKVKMLVLREAARPRHGDKSDGEAREYSHRFIVRGFWRNQPCGPHNSERRLQWIPPFVKGPAGAPLVAREAVRIWKR
ncbi:hypothetical protein [Collinsella ihumii]|uniref:hypothetical protein n=1 Tax=Collinsella ihumii TaxID=1720204 RepID=UPI0025AA9798|nr:hypothetical protein [Collinsella ihumii]MDN0055555.1 hypothetical protein [Collinsella ihumii]